MDDLEQQTDLALKLKRAEAVERIRLSEQRKHDAEED